MKLRIGNACWHAFHIQHAFLCQEAGFFAQEGIDAEIVHAKINPKGIDASRPDGERYDEVGTVLRDMVAYGIDIIPDVHVRTPFAERVLGNDEVVIIGGWRNQFRGTLVGAPGIQSIADLRGKRVGDWYKGGIATMWYEHQLRKAGVDPDREIQWKIGYKFGSMREAYKPLLAGDTDAAIVQNPYVPMLLERGFNKIYDFVEDSKPHGRPDRVTVARRSFVARNPEIIKRYWKASIRGYQFIRIAPENYPFLRFVEAKLRLTNPDEAERMRDLWSMELMEGAFFPMDGQLSAEGVWRILEEHQDAGVLAKSISRADVEQMIQQDLACEAWVEISQTDEIKRNLERLQPVIERHGY
ncbi:MAG: transporter substrate-binding protein [Deltaproteobacteria bacterium]|nr:transporter substrate-binding protein [Deltaproteobacteria bacterium]